MPRERRVQAEAEWGQPPGARRLPVVVAMASGGRASFSAASLVAVGAIVVFSALGSGQAGGPGSDLPATPTRPRPACSALASRTARAAARLQAPPQRPTAGTRRRCSRRPVPVVPLTNLAPPAVQSADTPPTARHRSRQQRISCHSRTGADGGLARFGRTVDGAGSGRQGLTSHGRRLVRSTGRAGARCAHHRRGQGGPTVAARVDRQYRRGGRPELQELRAGGIVYVQNVSTAAEARTINSSLMQIARDTGVTPPIITMDHEGGIVQRIKDVKNEGNNWDSR